MIMPPISPPPLFSHCQCLHNTNTIHGHINTPLLPPYTDHKMFLVICELIGKLSGSFGDDHDGVHHAMGNRLNNVIFGVNKGSKAMCKEPPLRLSTKDASTTLMPPHHNANFQLDCIYIYIYIYMCVCVFLNIVLI